MIVLIRAFKGHPCRYLQVCELPVGTDTYGRRGLAVCVTEKEYVCVGTCMSAYMVMYTHSPLLFTNIYNTNSRKFVMNLE